jgi:hypothetical protein
VPQDLEGVVGKSTECEVVMSDTNTFQAIVTVEKIEDDTVDYTMTAALTKAQVEKTVVHYLASANNGVEAQSVMCDTGLNGKQGATVHLRCGRPRRRGVR